MASVIWIEPLGNVGNRALQYLAAQGIARLVPGAEIRNIRLPEWGMNRADAKPEGRVVHTGLYRYWMDTAGMADCLRRSVMDALAIDGYCFHIEHYPPREVCRALLGPMQGGEDAVGFGPEALVCSVRGDEVLRAIHPRYLALPPGYYAKLAAQTGLELVFYGQLGEDPYSRSLRAAFPDARFISGRNPGFDFETLRRSQNIAPSLSTFAWLAAWLSEAAQIHLPVGGIYMPLQQGNQGFLPYDDPAYSFMLLPKAEAINVFHRTDAFLRQQEHIGAACQPLTTGQVRKICKLATQVKPYGPALNGFDPDFYVTQAGPKAAANPLEHYMRTGWEKGLKIALRLTP